MLGEGERRPESHVLLIAPLNYKELAEKLRATGKRHLLKCVDPGGDPQHLWVDPETGAAVVIPDRGNTPLSPKSIDLITRRFFRRWGMTYKELAEKLIANNKRAVSKHGPNSPGDTQHLWVDPETGAAVVIPDRGNTPLSPKIIARVCERLNLGRGDLDDLDY